VHRFWSVAKWIIEHDFFDVVMLFFGGIFIASFTVSGDDDNHIVSIVKFLIPILIVPAFQQVLRRVFLKKAMTTLVQLQSRTLDISRGLVVADSYFFEKAKYSIFATALLALCLYYAVSVKDWMVVGVVFTSMAMIGAFLWLTWLRCSRGWFADNSLEVLELLTFIVRKANDGGLPPGAKATHPFAEAITAQSWHDEKQVAGVTP
jgi:hypothetical protein